MAVNKNITKINTTTLSSSFFIAALLFIPALAAATYYYWADPFDPAPYPAHELAPLAVGATAPKVNGGMLRGSDFVGSGQLSGPEDVVYDPKSRVMYTGCADGWIKRVKLADSVGDSVVVVEDWVNTGGRPLGLAIAGGGDDIIVSDAHKGLLRITKDREIKLLTTEAEGQRFKLTDGVDVAKDGIIYFTDASYKYTVEEYLLDVFEGRPYGRLLSFNPDTGETKVLLRNLYFANGVAISPEQNSLIFCESPLKRCRRYWLQGSRKGSVDTFVDNLPGFPDNIHYDGQNNYLIAISSSLPPYMEKASRHQVVRKSLAIIQRYISLSVIQKNGGILAVDLQGNPTAQFYDPGLSTITSGIKVEDHLYIGSLHYSHIIRFNMSS